MLDFAKWIVAPVAALVALYLIAQSFINQGRDIERADRAVTDVEVTRLAVDRGSDTAARLEEMERRHARELAARDAELSRLRRERGDDENAGDVVFDDNWADWLRGGEKPADR